MIYLTIYDLFKYYMREQKLYLISRETLHERSLTVG